MWSHKLWAVIGVVALAVAACGGSSTTSPPSGSSSGHSSGGTVQVGLIEPLTGPFGFYGGFVANSMQVEINKINSSGGLLGKQVVLITRDDQLAPGATISAVRELATDPNVKLIEGPSFTALYEAARPTYEQDKALNCQVAVDATNGIHGAKYTFRTGVYNTVSDAALLSYLSRHTSVKSIGLVYSHDATGESIDADLKALAPKYGIHYLGVQYFNEGAQNMTSQVSALKNAGAIYLSGQATDAAETAASARQVGYKGALIGNSGLQGFTYVDDSSGAAANTIYSSNNLDYDTQIPQGQWPAAYREHVNAVVAKYGITVGPKSGVKEFKGTTLSGDCIAEWSAAVKAAGSFDATKVAQAWANLSLPASAVPSGIAVHFSPDNHDEYQSPSQMYIYQIVHRAGKWYLQQLGGPAS